MKTASYEANMFVTLLNAKLANEKHRFSVRPGTKFDKIVLTSWGSDHVHAFVNGDGGVLKAASWLQPAKDVRYGNVTAAAEAADLHGSYLYKK